MNSLAVTLIAVAVVLAIVVIIRFEMFCLKDLAPG